MSTRLEICQAACGMVGVNIVENLQGDRAEEKVCRHTLDLVIRELLSTRKFSFIEEDFTLTHVGQTGPENLKAVFTLPAPVLKAICVYPESDGRDYNIPYKIEGQLIYCDLLQEDIDATSYHLLANATGTGVTDYKVMDDRFVMIAAYRMAAILATGVLKETSMSDYYLEQYKVALKRMAFVEASSNDQPQRLRSRQVPIRRSLRNA